MKFEKNYDEVEQSVFKQLNLSEGSESFARRVVTRDVDAYMNIKIAKGGKGKTRHISAPLIELAKIQRSILEELENIVQNPPRGKRLVHPAAHAYKKFRSSTSAASVHLGMKWGVKVDLQKFYDNITEQHVHRAFERAGLKDQAYFWTKLCTRVPANWPEGLPPKYRRFQRAFTMPISNYLYDSNDRWFAQLLPRQILANQIRKQPDQSDSPSEPVVRLLPPKRVQRIFLQNSTGRVGILDLANLETQLLFERVKAIFGIAPDPDKNREFIKLIQSSRKKWREHILSTYEDRVALGHMNGDERQKHYSVRPKQYRLHSKIGYLPQGSPASGIISNMVMAQFDEVISEFCRSNSLRYTRYSDDIVISSMQDNFSRDRALKIVAFIQKLSEFNGFSLNKEKTRIMTPGSRKYVLGVLVDGSSLRLGKHERERIERMIYQIAKFGDFWSDRAPSIHMLSESHTLPGKRLGTYNHPGTPSDPLASLLGWLSYCKTADLEFLKRIHLSLQTQSWKFSNPIHEEVISTHVSRLLEFLAKRTGTSDDANGAPQGAHWNAPLTGTSETESNEGGS